MFEISGNSACERGGIIQQNPTNLEAFQLSSKSKQRRDLWYEWYRNQHLNLMKFFPSFKEVVK